MALWHLPIVAVGALPPFASVVTFAITFVYVWLFNHTGGSVLLVLAFHVAQGHRQLRRVGLHRRRRSPDGPAPSGA